MTPTIIGDCVLYNADCLDVLPTLESGSIDSVLTDPPYAIPTIVAAGRNTTRTIGDLSLIESAFRAAFAEWSRVTKAAARFFVFCDGTSYPVVFRAAYGKFSTALLVWNKGRIGMGREFRKSHELIMHVWKDGTPVYSDGVGRPDVMTFKPVGDERVHDAQKPVDLLEHLLVVCGGTVLDPFMGSGSTAIACINTGRKFIGIECDPDNFRIACDRIRKAYAETPLLQESA